MAKVWYSLGRDKILNKTRSYPKIREQLVEVLRNAPMKKAGFIADKNWDGKGNWMIKVSEQNMVHVKKIMGAGKVTGPGGKEVTYELASGAVKAGKAVPVKLRFKKSSKIERTKAGTEEQEKGSAYIFRRALNDNRGWQTWEDIVADVETYDELVKIFDGDVPDDWLISYFAQQKVLLNEVKPLKFSEFDHSGKGSFMDFITKLVLTKFNSSLSLGGKKDSWNPADIWIINGNQQNIRTELENSVKGSYQTIHELNGILRDMYRTGRVMGISLKKTGKIAYYEKVNLNKDGFIPDTKNYNYDVPMSDFYATFMLENTGMFTQDVKITVDADAENKTFAFQIKANSSDATGGSNLKFEPTMKGAAAARLGKAPVEQVATILKEVNSQAEFKNDHKLYPKTTKEFEKHPKKGEEYFRNQVLPALTRGTKKITTDITDIDDIILQIKSSYGTKMDRGTNVKAKLMGLDFFYQVSKLTQAQRNEFITDMIFLAQKKATKKIDHFGPFGKIY